MRKCRNWQTRKTKDLVAIAVVWVQVPSSAFYNLIFICGSVGTGRRARLRILWLLQSCGFKSHLPHDKMKRLTQMCWSFHFIVHKIRYTTSKEKFFCSKKGYPFFSCNMFYRSVVIMHKGRQKWAQLEK